MTAALDQLRKIISQTAPPPVVARGASALETGYPRVDALLGGGLPRGKLVEVSGAWSSGKTALLLGAAARVTGRRQLCAYIDGRAELYPPSAAALGVDLDRLLVVRPPPRDVARAGEIVTRSGAFALVILDLARDHRIEEAAAGRLRAALAGGATTVVALAEQAGALAAAVTKLQVDAQVVTLRKGGQAPPGSQARMTPARDFHDEPLPALERGGIVLRRRA